MAKYSYLTPEGMEKLKKDLQEMKTKGRREIAKQIQEARDKGDLSENAEYHAAKESQGMLEMKIAKLEEALNNSRLIDESALNTSKVMILSIVEIKNITNGTTVTYKIVSEEESNIQEGKISVDSPIGKGLFGKKVGQVTKIKTPSGNMKFEIVSISM